ncbi:mycofactocin biosynthesis peptidyl-dipeptidase MftE [Streptomyces sp. NPDC059262]|jgi:creatinine amidohydrolase|uniref:mycofactocin biosynthesis peptidyl-dipeptidase MftE n=1 Tax=Streptomyces sp. NPDC059262 TaxID=3346797 RepID=UPI0036CA303C
MPAEPAPTTAAWPPTGDPAGPSTRLAHHAWPDLEDRAPLVLLPLGSFEQHGPHLPLDTDTAVASAVAGRAAARLRGEVDVLVAPAQSYGASGEHEGFPGTVSVGHDALRLLVTEIGRSMLRWAGRLLVVNGHGGNLVSLADAVTGLRDESRDVAWWPCLPPGSDAHAGRTETSMMLRLRRSAVREDRAVAGPTDPVHLLMDRLVAESVRGVSPSGVLGDPAGARASEGERLLDRMADRLATDLRAWRVSGHGRLGTPERQPAAAGAVR